MRRIIFVLVVAALVAVMPSGTALAVPTFETDTSGVDNGATDALSPPALSPNGPTGTGTGLSETCNTLNETPVTNPDSDDALVFRQSEGTGQLRCNLDAPTV